MSCWIRNSGGFMPFQLTETRRFGVLIVELLGSVLPEQYARDYRLTAVKGVESRVMPFILQGVGGMSPPTP